MPDVLNQIDRIIRRWRLPWSRLDGEIDVELWRGGRRQRVFVEPIEGGLRFWSIVAGAAHVRQSDRYWRELALRAWRKNASKEIVTFCFDRRDRLIGCADHSGTDLTDPDLRTYIEVIARECDHFEFLLSGEDRD